MVTMVCVVSRFRLKAPPRISSSCISPLTSSGQRSRASWASQPQKSATLSPQPGGKPRKFIRTCGGIGGEVIIIIIIIILNRNKLCYYHLKKESHHFQSHYQNCDSASTPQSGTSHKTCLRGFGGNRIIAWTSAVSHVGRTLNAFKVTMKLQTFLFQMVVTSCISVQYL